MARPAETAAALGERLAQSLIERLQPHLPGGVVLTSDGTSIEMRAPNGLHHSCPFMDILDQAPGPEAHIENAIFMVLDHVQDFVMEDVLREPWPKLPDPVLAYGPTSSPDVRREEGSYRLFYSPALELARLTDVELGIRPD